MMSGSWNRFCRCMTAFTVRQIQLACPSRDFDFLCVRAFEAGNAVGHNGFIALKTDLDVTQSGIGQRAKSLLGQQHRRRNEIGVQPDIVGMLHKFDQVLARGGLAAGEMDLQYADFGELGEHLLPFLSRQFAAATFQLDRIGAIRTLQRTSMRYLGERAALLQHRKPVRGRAGHRAGIGKRRTHEALSRASVKNPLSARSCSMAMTSAAIALRSAVYFAASWSIIAPTPRTPSQS